MTEYTTNEKRLMTESFIQFSRALHREPAFFKNYLIEKGKTVFNLLSCKIPIDLNEIDLSQESLDNWYNKNYKEKEKKEPVFPPRSSKPCCD